MVPSKIEGQDVVDIGPQIRITDADTQAVHRRIAGIQLRGVGRSPLAGIAQVESNLVGGGHIVVQLQPALFNLIIQVGQRGIAVNIRSLRAVARCAGGIFVVRVAPNAA